MGRCKPHHILAGGIVLIQDSRWVRLETGAFRGLQAKDQKMGHSRVLINLVIDSGYSPEPFDLAYIYIDATDKPQREWIVELQRALHLGQEATAANPVRSDDRRSTPQRPTQQAGSKYVESVTGALPQAGVPRVVVRQGKEVGRIFTLHAASMNIGTSSIWPIQLSDPEVGAIHASIRRKSTGKRYIHDIGSKTGTFVNGKLIDSEQELHDGDEIRIGNTLLGYEEGKESS